MIKTIETAKVTVDEINENIPGTIEKCLGKKLITDPIKHKIFIAKNLGDEFAVFVANDSPGTVQINIFLNIKSDRSDLVDGIEEFLRKLAVKFGAKTVRIRVKDNEGIIKQALQTAGFSIVERKDMAILFEKKLRPAPEKIIEQKVVKKAQKPIITTKPPVQPLKVQEKIVSPPEIVPAEKTVIQDNAISAKATHIEIPAERIVASNNVISVEKKSQTIGEKIQEVCKRFNLNNIQRSILEVLAEEPLSESEIRLKSKFKGDIKGQLMFLKQQKLIKNKVIRGKYQINI